jgi:hypothetical protein
MRLAVALLTAASLLLLSVITTTFLWLPEWIATHLRFTTPADYFIFLASTRSSVATMLGSGITAFSALAAFATVYSTFRSYVATVEKHSADVLAKATELIGSQNVVTRVGGIHALQRLGETSRNDYLPVLSILTTVLRSMYSHSPSEEDARGSCPADAQAILSSVGKRTWKALEGTFRPDVSQIRLHNARFAERTQISLRRN